VYPILDVSLLGARSVAETASTLLAGGARMIQLRAKQVPDLTLLELTRQALAVVRAGGGLLIVNDRPDVALVAGADGVHVGQDDLPPAECRRLLGGGAIVGWSAHSAQDVAAADERILDYVALGPVFATSTKADAEPVVGVAAVKEARPRTRLPLVAIGGITAGNAAAVVAAGADGVAAASSLMRADTAAAVRALVAAVGTRA
jgi:thiamine-phosphate pyrophosphorylase